MDETLYVNDQKLSFCTETPCTMKYYHHNLHYRVLVSINLYTLVLLINMYMPMKVYKQISNVSVNFLFKQCVRILESLIN